MTIGWLDKISMHTQKKIKSKQTTGSMWIETIEKTQSTPSQSIDRVDCHSLAGLCHAGFHLLSCVLLAQKNTVIAIWIQPLIVMVALCLVLFIQRTAKPMQPVEHYSETTQRQTFFIEVCVHRISI